MQYIDLGTRWTNIGSVFVKVTGVWAQVKHRYNADASLGVAVNSGSGYYASYTVDRYSSSEIQFPRYGRYSYKFFDTQRPYGKYYNYNNCGVLINTTVKPINGAGNSGSRERNASHLIPANQPRERCAPGIKGAKHIQSTEKAITWATGAKVEDIVGFDMSTRTGFSQQASHEFEFMSAGRAVCGTQSDPSYPGDPGVLVVQYY